MLSYVTRLLEGRGRISLNLAIGFVSFRSGNKFTLAVSEMLMLYGDLTVVLNEGDGLTFLVLILTVTSSGLIY